MKYSPARLNELYRQVSYVPRTLGIIWAAAAWWTLAWLVLISIGGLLPAAVIYLSRILIDVLGTSIGIGWSWPNLAPAAMSAGLMATAVILIEITAGLGNWVRMAQAELVRDYLSDLIHGKSITVDLAFHESSAYHDRLERARNELGNRPLALLESLGNLLQNSITLIAVTTLLIPYGLWLPIVLIIGTVPAFYVVLKFNRRYHCWWEETTPNRRRAQYYDMILTHSAVAAELRLFDLGAHFRCGYQALRHCMRAERLEFSRDQGLARVGAGLIGFAVSGVALVWVIWRGFDGKATLGDIALLYQAFQRGQGLLRSLLENVGQIYANTLFLGNLFEFLELTPEIRDPLKPVLRKGIVSEGIIFRNITFGYPGNGRKVLNDFSLTVPAGQIVAVVGANGAGKSTLLKLLCRFYDPEAGGISIDGTDIRRMSLQNLRRMITVLFQCPVMYQSTAAENIACGDLGAKKGSSELRAAALSAGTHDLLSRLPQGYETLLGKWFPDGVELSAGEWQKVALARAFFRQSQILILDEPTSALDSWAEADWFDRFRFLANGRTAIIITHRFTIARRADMIHVMDAGRIVESGRHEKLVALHGMYARSWAAQVQENSPTCSLVMDQDPDDCHKVAAGKQ